MAAVQAGAQVPGGASTEDDNKVTLNKREMRLGLRHRDSFAVHKSHIQHAQGAAGREAAILGALAGSNKPAVRSKSQSSVAGVLEQAGATPDPGSAESGNSGDDDDDDYDENEGALYEGGAENDDGEVTINPDSETDILAALESLAGNAQAPPPPQSGSGGADAPKRKSKVRSVVKGIASALGLRKSKKKRQAEESVGSGGSGGAPPPPLLSPSAKALSLARSASAGNVLGEHEHLAGATREDLEQLATGRAIAKSVAGPLPSRLSASVGGGRASVPRPVPLEVPAQLSASSSWEEHEPARDEMGAYMPCHKKEVRVPSILKGSAMGRKALAAVAASVAPPGSKESGTGGSGFGSAGSPLGVPFSGEGSPAPTTPLSPTGRRGIVFADQTGHPLTHVHFSEQLHYGENSVHEEWDEDEEEGNGKCVVM